MTIRRLGPGDVDLFRTIRLEALRSEPEAFRSRHEDALRLTPDAWRARLEENAIFASFDGDAAVGLAGLDPRTGHAIMVYLRASVRGQGRGRALMAAVLGVAREAGLAELRLRVFHANDAALGLYRSVGFKVVGEEDAGATLVMARDP